MPTNHRHRQLTALYIIILIVALSPMASIVSAQVRDTRWSEPLRLSNADTDAGEATIFADPYGFVYAFWPETSRIDSVPTIQFARFNGSQWSQPIDIYVGRSGDEIRDLHGSLDTRDFVHLTWVNSQNGPITYISAPLTQLNSARAWTNPIRIDFRAYQAFMHVDDQGILHLVYSVYFGKDPGVFYSRSDNQGTSWIGSQQLDINRTSNYVPQALDVAFDSDEDFHAVWWDKDTQLFAGNSGIVYYIHSQDNGRTWSQPFTVAGSSESNTAQLGLAEPLIALSDEQVLLMWTEGDRPYRKFRTSPDNGSNWTEAAFIQTFGELHGQAFDSLAVDGIGRVHFLGDIRYPQGLYHAFYEPDRWSIPNMIFEIQTDSSGQSTNNSIHVHHVKSTFRAGSQLVALIMNSPGDPQRILYTMSREFEDIPPVPPKETPTPITTETPTPTAIPEDKPTPTLIWSAEMQANAPALPGETNAGGPIYIAIAVAGAIVIGILLFRLANSRMK